MNFVSICTTAGDSGLDPQVLRERAQNLVSLCFDLVVPTISLKALGNYTVKVRYIPYCGIHCSAKDEIMLPVLPLKVSWKY